MKAYLFFHSTRGRGLRLLIVLFVVFFVLPCLTACTGIMAISPKDFTAILRDSPAEFKLALAGKSDGTYRGSCNLAIPPGSIAVFRSFQVDVLVSSGRISRIDLIEPQIMRTADFFLELPARIVKEQSIHVDSVSGATFSSKSFLKAVEHAIID
jgi:uncharacterized protein with FMN-binding domain